MRALLEGVLAGLGIAVPVGPIAVLLVDLAMRRGFVHSVPAAIGAASADLTYATVAAVLGAAAADALEPVATPLRVVSIVVLLAIVVVRTWRLLRSPGTDRTPSDAARKERGGIPTYAAYLGLTLLNPVTVTYFAALILGLQADSLTGVTAKALFVAGAFGASAAWQLTLVAAGGLLHHRLPRNTAMVTGLVGNGVIVAFAIRLALA